MCVHVCVNCICKYDVRMCYFLSQEQCEYELEQTFKKFTTKPVTQVALVTEHNLLLMLAGM